MTAPAFEAVHRAAALGEDAGARFVDDAGRSRRLDALAWHANEIAGDAGLLARAGGSTLDVGCGPGRLTAALPLALGIDVSPAAVRSTRRRGGRALLGDVFGPLPLEGRWHTILLADGNIGIAGEPGRLLRRCAALLGPGGRVLAELDPPGTPSWSGAVWLRTDVAPESPPLRWAYVSADDIASVAASAGLLAESMWTEEGRWFASLTHR